MTKEKINSYGLAFTSVGEGKINVENVEAEDKVEALDELINKMAKYKDKLLKKSQLENIDVLIYNNLHLQGKGLKSFKTIQSVLEDTGSYHYNEETDEWSVVIKGKNPIGGEMKCQRKTIYLFK